MYFVATVLAILSGLFYAAGHNEIGSFGVHHVPIRRLVLQQPDSRSDSRGAGWPCGAASSAYAEAQTTKLANSRDDGVVLLICPTCQTEAH